MSVIRKHKRIAAIPFVTGMISAASAVSAVSLGGCYHHVVGVSGGTGHDRRVIYEPNLDPDERVPIVDDLEDAVLGEPQ